MARRSRPPRQRKSRPSEAPPHDVVVVMPANPAPSEELAAEPVAPTPEHDELAALDAGWD